MMFHRVAGWEVNGQPPRSTLAGGLAFRLDRRRHRAGLEFNNRRGKHPNAVFVEVDHGVIFVTFDDGTDAVLSL